MTLPRIPFLIMLAAMLGLTPAAAQQVRTPSPGTSERTQILDALRPSPGSKIRFIVHQLKVIKGRTATYAYAVIEPSQQEYEGGEFLLKQDGGWRVIWSVTGGGTDDCQTAASYYQSALRLFQAEGIDPDAISPQLHEEYLRLSAFATEDPDCTSLGDLGPDLPVNGEETDDQDGTQPSNEARSRIAPHPRFRSPVTQADLDGDGKPEVIEVVHILPGGARREIDPALRIANPWNIDASAQGLADEDQTMALVVENSRSAARYLLHSPYVEISARVRAGHPVEAQRANTRLARGFRKDCPDLRHDFLLMATEASIDIALFWNAGANRYDVCWPNEIP